MRVEKRSRTNRSLAWLWGQLDEFLGRQASFPPRTTHRHRLEDAMSAPFVTIGAGAVQRLLNRRTLQAAGSCLLEGHLWGVGREAIGCHLQAGSSQLAKDDGGKLGIGVPRSIEPRNRLHACIALRWNETKIEDGLTRIKLEKTREREAERGARLKIETGAEFPIGASGPDPAR